jgi:threonine/homoserine/homoserine lactone efflux protein
MLSALVTGILLGLSAGLAPGPLLALLLTQTLQHGPREGCKIALAPLITDLPIILLTLLLASAAPQFEAALGLLSLAGGAFVLWLAVASWRAPRFDATAPIASAQSWRKGILVNLLNPHPWLFWFTVGAATLAKALANSWLAAALFVASFYTCLVGSKVVLAVSAGRSRAFLTGRLYQWVLRLLGVLMAVFALLLLRDGLKHLWRIGLAVGGV